MDLRINSNSYEKQNLKVEQQELEKESDISLFMEETNSDKTINKSASNESGNNKIETFLNSLFSEGKSNKISDSITNTISNVLSSGEITSIDTEKISKGISELGNILNDAGINSNSINSNTIKQVTNSIFDELKDTSNITGTINVDGKEIVASKVADVMVNTLEETANASGEVIKSLISNSIDVSNGTKDKETGSKSFLEDCKNFFKGIGDSINKFLEETGLGDKLEKMKDFYVDNIKTFVGSFLKNAIKTIITNPASLADPALFLTQTLTSTVADKSFQTGIAKNFSNLIGIEASSTDYSQMIQIAQIALKATQK